jgi:hypothetical protein
MNLRDENGRWWRGVCVALAALALVVKIAIPAGFMVAETNTGAFPLVLCTAQGAVVLENGYGAPVQPKAPQGHEAPCAFTGHGAAFLAPVLVGEALVHPVSYDTVSPARVAFVSPGRGLVAPPPPARGPPLTA